MIELIILGFLSYNDPLTLYDIKKGMEEAPNILQVQVKEQYIRP